MIYDVNYQEASCKSSNLRRKCRRSVRCGNVSSKALALCPQWALCTKDIWNFAAARGKIAKSLSLRFSSILCSSARKKTCKNIRALLNATVIYCAPLVAMCFLLRPAKRCMARRVWLMVTAHPANRIRLSRWLCWAKCGKASLVPAICAAWQQSSPSCSTSSAQRRLISAKKITSNSNSSNKWCAI